MTRHNHPESRPHLTNMVPYQPLNNVKVSVYDWKAIVNFKYKPTAQQTYETLMLGSRLIEKKP